MKKAVYSAVAIVIFASIFGCAGTAQRGAMLRAHSGIGEKDYEFSLKRLSDAERYVAPEPELQAEISYLKGLCFEGLYKSPEAKAMYKFVTDKFPDSQYSYLARERLSSMDLSAELENRIFFKTKPKTRP